MLVKCLRPHQRLRERLETLPVLGEERDRLVVCLVDDLLDLGVDALPCALRDLGQALQGGCLAVLGETATKPICRGSSGRLTGRCMAARPHIVPAMTWAIAFGRS